MNSDDDDLRNKVALFRYGLIADLLHLKGPKSGLYKKLEEKAERIYTIPGSNRVRVEPETIRGWLKAYRKGEYEALLPKARADKGTSRAIPQHVQDILINTKETHEDYTVDLVIKMARKHQKVSKDTTLAQSTVHRLLRKHGLMQKKPEDPNGKDHRRFEFEKAGELWMSDVMHGPAVLTGNKRKHKTYLIGFLDDATRIVPYAAFAMSEGNVDFIPALKQALLRRGIPKRLFVDNGSAYRSHHLALIMAKMGVTLIHARVRHPQAKGKQERFFRRVRTQFMPLISNQTLTLDDLNREFWAWVEGEYHQTPHRGINGDTPADRWAARADEVRYPGSDLDDLFLFEAKRKVKKDRTVSLDGRAYEVEAMLVDETVILRFKPEDRRVMQVWYDGRRHQDALDVDIRANCHVKRNTPSSAMRLADLNEDC
jgi:putative transposase